MASRAASAAVAAPPRPRTRTNPAARPNTQAKPKPRTQSRAKAKRRVRARSGILWIVVSGVLLAGVVFVNVLVLRMNLELDKATQERAQLQAGNNALQSQLSAALASPKIQAEAHQKYGLVEVDPSGYVDLSR